MKDRLHAVLVAIPLLLVVAASGSQLGGRFVKPRGQRGKLRWPRHDARDVAGGVVGDR